jgi:predicted esterase
MASRMRSQVAWTIALLAVVVAAVPATIVAKRARGSGPAPSASAALFNEAAPESATPRTPPKPVRRDSVLVPLSTGNPSEAFWQMHEAAPLIEPDDETRPVTLLLHGMCADSSWTCDWLQYFPMAPQWQVCPRATRKCSTEPGYSWTNATDTRRIVELSLATLKQRHGERVRDDSIVVAGFSLGSHAIAGLVRELARQAPRALRLRGIVVQGAPVHFSAADLRKLGARIAFTAGDLDGAAPAMRAEAEKLRREGIDSRYASLGKDESHFSSVATGRTIAQLIDWCRRD